MPSMFPQSTQISKMLTRLSQLHQDDRSRKDWWSARHKNILNPTVKKAAEDISTTAGPATEDTTTDGTDPAAADPAEGDYGVTYTMQTGPTRYAPMQPVPPTKITAKNTKPLYPTSSVKIAKSKLPIPTIQTTLTQSQTFSVKSMENTVRHLLCAEMRDLLAI